VFQQQRMVTTQERMASSLDKMVEKPKPAESLTADLERLHVLLEEGAITKEEYEKAKKNCLSKSSC